MFEFVINFYFVAMLTAGFLLVLYLLAKIQKIVESEECFLDFFSAKSMISSRVSEFGKNSHFPIFPFFPFKDLGEDRIVILTYIILYINIYIYI